MGDDTEFNLWQIKTNQFSLFDSVFKESSEYWRRVSNLMSDTEYEAWIMRYVSGDTGDADDAIDAPNDEDADKVYCVCRQPESGRMIACDGHRCRTEWFHFKCVGIKESPSGDWFCGDCSLDDAKFTGNFQDYNYHRQQTYGCKNCLKTFTHKRFLKKHKRSHKANYGPVPCPECPKNFRTILKLRKHLDNNVHSNKRPFHCQNCSKSFKQPGHLDSHKAVHTNLKLYQCSLCFKSFKIKNYLSKHIRVHK